MKISLMKSMEVISELRKENTMYMLLRHDEALSQLIAGGVCSHPAQEPTSTLLNLQVSDNKFLNILVLLTETDIWSLRNLVVSLLTIFVLKPYTPYYCGYLKLVMLYRVQKVKATYQLILTFRLKASIFTACLSPDVLGVNDKKWAGDSRQM